MLACLVQLAADLADGAKGIHGTRLAPSLFTAAELGHPECVRILLEEHVDPNRPGLEGRGTPLSVAATNGHHAICRLLLEDGADPNCHQNNPSILPALLKHTKRDESFRIAKLLVERGADLNAMGADEKSPILNIAILGEHEGFAHFLLDQQAELGGSSHGWTPLHAAFEKGSDIYKLLVQRGQGLDTPDSRGFGVLPTIG
jgi:ankyrin repeat protein